jgi:hypothetical protein
MSLKHTLEAIDLLDDPHVSGSTVAEWWRQYGADEVHVQSVESDKGHTDFVRVLIPGNEGKSRGGHAPTLGVIGRLGGLGARPSQIGLVSDGDGAATAITAAAKLLQMREQGDVLPGDVIVTTHIDPQAPTRDHHPVPFMDSAVTSAVDNSYEVLPAMDAILSIDTTKGNRVCNHQGFAITPTAKEGYLLRISESLLDIVERTSGRPPVIMPITTQDITPYGNDVYHVNSLMQPTVATPAPVVGVAITTETVVAGSATGAADPSVIETTARFAVETAKDFTRGIASFYDAEEFRLLVDTYGQLNILQTLGTHG